MRKFLKNSFMIAVISAVFFSCSHFSIYEKTQFYLPDEGEWEIFFSDGNFLCTAGNSFSIETEKNTALSMIASRKDGTEKCGGIYPFNIELSSENLFPAEVHYSIFRSSLNSLEETKVHLTLFNWPRFEKDCSEFGSDIWKVNKEVVMRKIAAGTFKKSDLKVNSRN